jgi:hypothetical protein
MLVGYRAFYEGMCVKGQTSESAPVTVYLPKGTVETIDQLRGRISRSLYIALVLENAIKNGGLDGSQILAAPNH